MFELPLINGYVTLERQRSVYWKNEFSEVSILLSIARGNPDITSTVCAVLPKGYYPDFAATAAIQGWGEHGSIVGVISFKDNGQLVVDFSDYYNQTVDIMRGYISFIAME